MKHRFTASLLMVTTAAIAFSPMLAHALPNGGSVTSGSATITNSGAQTTINQTTPKAIINWTGFNASAGETVKFNQPNAQSVTLNRVMMNPTFFDGNLTANGKVWIINQSGIVFGKNAKVNVGSLLATTSNITDQDFNAGKFNFKPTGNPTATVKNEGSITVAQAGLATLVAPNVVNSGAINAKLGKITLASGDTFALDTNGDGLVSLAVSPQMAKQLVDSTGTLDATGGSVALTAGQATTVIDSLINLDGLVKGNNVTATNHNGDVTYGAKYNDYANGSKFTLSAARNVTVKRNATAGKAGSKVDITLGSDNKGKSNGAIYVADGATLASGGGNITLGGGTYPSSGYAYGNTTQGGDIGSNGRSVYANGVTLGAATIDAGGGNIRILGVGKSSGSNVQGTPIGDGIYAGRPTGPVSLPPSITTSGAGSILMQGIGGNDSTMSNISNGVNMTGYRIATDSGMLRISGTGGYGSQSNGVVMDYDVVESKSGPLTIVGQGSRVYSTYGSNGVVLSHGSVTNTDGTLNVSGWAGNGGSNEGVSIYYELISSKNGHISLVGQGYSTTPGSTVGLSIGSYSTVRSTGTGPNAAEVNLLGKGSGGGVRVTYGSNVTSVDGAINVMGSAPKPYMPYYVDNYSGIWATGEGKVTYSVF